MRNNYEIVQELKEEEKQGRLFSSTKESSKNNSSDQNLDPECFKNFFENAPIYEYMVSPEETILEINKTACTNLGYKKEELLGKHLTAIYAPESHEKMKTLLTKWKETGEIDNEEMVIATKQGEKRRVLLSASSVRGTDGTILYSISVLKDVTDINKIYDELNKNLWLQNVKLQKLNETKKTFLKTTSHELRTPITSIKGYVQMLIKKTLGEINERQMQGLEVILRNTNRLDQVIQNILDASSLESGIMKFIPRKVNPRALVEEITKTMEPFAKKKEMTITVNLEKDLPDLMIDGERIKQVLMHLVDNAIKFSPDGSMIHVKARKEKEDVLFEVQDFGQGMPKDKQGMIFDAFYQADSGDDRLFGGAGLSLALSKGIVGLHGGKIWFESTEGAGSTFLFTLPILSISDMNNTELMEEMPTENTSAESIGLSVNSVTLNTTDEDVSGSIAEHKKITATSKEDKERYEALFNSSFELVYLHDLKGNFIDANPTALKLLGYRKEELGSLNFSSLLDSGQIWKAMKALNEIKKYGCQKEPTEYRLKLKNGTLIDVETTAELVYRDGKPYSIQGIARNITEKKQAQQILKESEEKYRTLFETTPDLIVETDEKGILLVVNPAMADHFGTPVEKLIGKNIFDILPKEVMEERAKIARKALKDGKIQINEDENAGRHFHNVYVPIIHPDGRKTLQLVARDITAAKKAEEEIRYLKDYNENILESNPNPIFIIKGKQIEYVNRAFIFAFGEIKKEYITRNLKEVIPSEVLPVFEKLLQEDGGSKELKFRGKDFIVRSFVVKKAEEEEEEEEMMRGMVFQDISERKKTEEELKESEEKFRDLFENANDLIQSADTNGRFIYVNKKWLRTLGYTEDEVKGLTIIDILRKDQIPHCMEIIKEVCGGKSFEKVETVFVSKDGREIYVEGSANAKFKDGEFIATRGIFRDITASKKLKETLRLNEDKLRRVIESSPDNITISDLNGTIIDCNQATVDMHGFSKKEEIIGKNALELIALKDHEKAMKNLKKTLEVEPVKNVEYTFLKKDGSEFPVEMSASAIKDPSGKLISFIGVIKDISERKKAEQLLKESEEKFRTIFDNSTEGILLADMENKKFFTGNKTICNMLGYSAEEIKNLGVMEIHPKEDLPFVVEQFEKQARKEIVLVKDLPIKRKDGSVFYADVNSAPMTIAGKKYLAGSFRDVTERKQTINELEKNETLLNDVSEMAQVGGWDLDIETKAVHWTKETVRIHDISMDEKFDLSKAVLFFDLPDRSNLEAALQCCIETGEPFDLVLPFTSAKGRHLWTRAIGHSMKNDSGKVVKVIGTFQDITERKRVEAEREKTLLWQQGVNILQQSLLASAPLENKLKIITDSIVRLFDVDFCRIWLTQPGDLCEQGCIHAEVHEGPHVCRFRDRCLRLSASSGRYIHTDGKIHRRVPFGCYKIGRVASGEDHKFLTNDVQNDPRVHNNEWARELGLVSFAGYQLKIHGDETIGVLALFAKHPIQLAEDSMIDGISSIVARIVQQAIEAETMRESEERHRILFETSHDAIMTLEPPTWNFTTGNPATIELFKAKNEEEFTSQGPGNLSPERQPDGRASAEKAKEMIETAMREGSCFFEWTHKRMTGEDFPTTVLLSRIAQGGKIFLQATVRDITQQKQLEIKLKEKIDDLELFKKLTVGRELKMVELKKEIEELNKELKEEK